MTLTRSSVPRRRPGVEVEVVGEQAVMLDAAGTVARGLNQTAARVWELMDGRRTVAEIAVLLEGERDVEADVLAFLAALLERDLISV
ncbi:MAG: PqqD family protein [Myxococcaceae bacterium]|nr:PqqD family protein [Myxococcaceae bacterium]